MTKRLTHIDRYRIVKVLGHGGMGTVYLCHDTDLDRPVAIKLFDVKKKKSNVNLLKQRFVREVLTTAALQHPCIPPVYEFRQHASGQLYYVMKPIDGQSLHDVIKGIKNDKQKNGFDLARLVEILGDVCQAVHYAHSRGFIHRDLKPANIFVGNYGEVYVIDWGLTKIIRNPQKNADAATLQKFPELEVSVTAPTLTLESISDKPVTDFPELMQESVVLTAPGNIMGTLPYMPPEQAEGDTSAVGRESDIYAIGVMLYEILTMELPFKAGTIKEMMRQKSIREVVPPEFKAPHREIPPELSLIAMQAMNPAPDERFKSVQELQQALESWLEGKSQFRPATKPSVAQNRFQVFPKGTRKSWEITDDGIATLQTPASKNDFCLLFSNDFIGDIRVSTNFIAYPQKDGVEDISEISIIINSYETTRHKSNALDGYVLTLGGVKNTRAVLRKNGVDLVSNDYITLEPRRRYRLTFERFESDIKVILNRQLILFYHDNDPLMTGTKAGFCNKGPGVVFSDIRVHVRGFPTRVPAMDVPEALMAENCYGAALQRFLAISLSHRNRHEGAWARYRAGIAAYRMDGKRSSATRIWAPLKNGHYAVFEKLGRAVLDIETGKSLKAASTINALLLSGKPIPNLDSVADIVFAQAQQVLRRHVADGHAWRTVDAWARLALVLAQRLENRSPLAPSILWQWIFLVLTEYPHHLSDCTKFLNETFGKGKGVFAETLTSIEPLMTILKRSAKMSDHSFLVDKVMKLILNHDDNLGNLETLVRFYLNSGHIEVAKKLSLHIKDFCMKHEYRIPPAPIAFTACQAWLSHDPDSGNLIRMMINNSYGWAPADGWLLLGLECLREGRIAKAHECWRSVSEDPDAISFNRHFIARGLLGLLAQDPVEAGVPNRSDHRLLYCLFLGFQNYAEWLRTGAKKSKNAATVLLDEVLKLMRPSYDIYSATDTFARIPLENMGVKVPSQKNVEPLSEAEKKWLNRLADAAAKEKPGKASRPSLNYFG